MTVTANARKARLKKSFAPPENGVAAAEAEFPGIYHRDSARAIFAIRALARVFEDRANGWLAAYGLNAAQHNYLTVLYFAPDGLTLRDLSRMVHTSNSAVTPIVTALERAGLVKRTGNPADGRSIVAVITRKGRALISETFPLYHRNIERGMAQLSDAERRTLAELLGKVGAGFDAYNDDSEL